ncbi:MAG: arsenite oxidase small subunit [Sulfurimonas sp.]|jgi:arsenite oxidase small subunit|uniref:Rieske 2Fe-2S domain-containing protein n=1 Tax=Sulfurimonas sp. TaxID=2022749 RepID=UPI0039E44F71
MERRNFLKVVGATGAMIAVSPSTITGKLYASDGAAFQAFEKVQLMDGAGAPLKASALKKEVNYVFNYPHASTPSILLDLPAPTNKDVKLTSADGEEYIWKGGVGSKGTIVAYSAICAHQMAHPTPEDSFLQYCKKGQETMAYAPEDGSKGGIMVCSSHLAAYDVGSGCKVLGGPAEQPLASIIIEVAADDTLWASAVLGGDKFHEYFKVFKPELKKYYGGKRKGKKKVEGSAKTVAMNEYTKEMIQY